MIKFYLGFDDNYFESMKIFVIGIKDSEKNTSHFWCLSDVNDFQWKLIGRETPDFRKKILINDDYFYKIKLLSYEKRSYIAKYDNPIELFKAWDLLEEIEEHLI